MKGTKKLTKLFTKAEECTSRKKAQKIIKKATKLHLTSNDQTTDGPCGGSEFRTNEPSTGSCREGNRGFTPSSFLLWS